MKYLKTFNEAKDIEVDDLKSLGFPKVARLYKLPTQLSTGSWSKRGGHAGQNTIRRVEAKLKELGWSRSSSKSTAHGGGENVSNTYQLSSPDGKLGYTSNAYYGSVASDNHYSMRITIL